jgi:DNA invertase Pin-like site-specific DNA recombinase
MDQREIDTTTPNRRLLFGILAAVIEFEWALIKDRQLAGIRSIEI